MLIDKNGRPLSSEKSFQNFSHDLSFLFGAVDVAGVNVNPLTAYQHGIVYSCVRVLAESVGQLPVRLFEIQEGERVKATRAHKMFEVLTLRPNSYMTWQEMLELIVTHLNLDGNFYAYVNKNRYNKIVEIIPIPTPSAVSMSMLNGKVTYRVSNNTTIKLPKYEFSDKEMLHIKGASIDGLVGVTPIRNAARTIGLSMASEEHGEQFFRNSATPNGYLTTDSSLSAEAIQRLRDNWAQNFQGLKNSSKTAVFEEGMEYKSISISNKDAQFLETRNFQKNEICSIFRVPPQMVYADANVTYSNVEQALLSFHRDTLIPLISRIVSRINMMLPDELEIDLDDSHILRGDSKTQAEVNSAYFKMGILSVNEIRANLGLEPIEGGDVRAIDTNNTTFGTFANLPQNANQTIPPEQNTEENEKDE